MDILANTTFPIPTATSININELVDIRTVVIDPSLPVPEKKRIYLNQIKNPKLYRCGDIVVRIAHVNTDTTLEDRLKQYLLSKQGTALVQ